MTPEWQFEDTVRRIGLQLRQMSLEEQEREIRRLPSRVRLALPGCWFYTARDNQLPLDVLPTPVDWHTRLIMTGRGWGKTRTGVEHIRHWNHTQPGCVVMVVVPTSADIPRVWLDGTAGLRACMSAVELDQDNGINRGTGIVTMRQGTRVLLISAEEPNRMRGPECHYLILDEFAAYKYAQEVLDTVKYCLRLAPAKLLITTTPKATKAMKTVLQLPGVHITRGTTMENRGALAPERLQQIAAESGSTRLYRQEALGELLEDAPGALWTIDDLDACRCSAADVPEDLARVAIAVDPATTANEDSDETGIIAAARGANKEHYVLADYSLVAKPSGWARAAVQAYYQHDADCIVAESNQGGLMVEETIKTVDPNVPVKLVHASRGKITRAEPVSAMYKQGTVHHAGTFTKLEDQMTTYEQGTPDSPDRLDALVWALTDLMLPNQHGVLAYWDSLIAKAKEDGTYNDTKEQANGLPLPTRDSIGMLQAAPRQASKHSVPGVAAADSCPKCGATGRAATNFDKRCYACGHVEQLPDTAVRMTNVISGVRH